jgi:K(+)-stimulated pyrophosphate-energized sodium pump
MTVYNFLPLLAGLLAFGLSVVLHLAARKRAPAEYSVQAGWKGLDQPFASLLILVVIGSGLYLWFSLWTLGAFLLGAGIAAAAGAVTVRYLELARFRAGADLEVGKAEGAFLVNLWHGGSVGLAVGGLGLVGVSLPHLLFLRGRIEAQEIVGFALGASLMALLPQLRILPGADSPARRPGEAGLTQSMLENLVLAVIAALAIAATGTSTVVNITAGNRLAYMSFPILVVSFGLLSSVAGLLLVRLLLRQGPGTAIRLGGYFTVVSLLASAYFAVNAMELEIGIFPAMMLGVISGVVIASVAEWYVCGVPAGKIAAASRSGPAANVVSGLAAAFQWSALPVLTVCGAVLIAFNYAGLYGIGICAAGMVATLGFSASFAAFSAVFPDRTSGPTGTPPRIVPAVSATQRAIWESTDNGATLLVVLALFAAYSRASGLDELDLMEPTVMVGLLAGGIVPFCAVSFAFGTMGSPLLRIPQLLLPFGAPVFVGLVLGREALGGMLLGGLAAGMLLALTLSTAGQLWRQVRSHAGADEGSVGLGGELGVLFQQYGGPAAAVAVKSSAVVALVLAPMLG